MYPVTNLCGILMCQVMWYLAIAFFIFQAYETHGIVSCVMTSPVQRVYVGEDVYLFCNFTQCPRPRNLMFLNVEWGFQNNSSDFKTIIYNIGNHTSRTTGVLFRGNVELGSFDILLQSVKRENNGTYQCKYRQDGIFYKNITKLTVHSATQTRRNSPGVNDIQVEINPSWWLALIPVAGIVLLIVVVFLGRLLQQKDVSMQEIEEVETRSDTADIRCKVTNNSAYEGDTESQPITHNADNIYVTMVTNYSAPVENMTSKPNSSNAENIYVTMQHGFQVTTDSPGQD
nr:uncharacterized protein LOC129437732 isoform X1 [Misgurnus anguillicaudatus]